MVEKCFLEECVVEECWRNVSQRNVGEVLERHVGEVCRTEVFLGCCRAVSETSVSEKCLFGKRIDVITQDARKFYSRPFLHQKPFEQDTIYTNNFYVRRGTFYLRYLSHLTAFDFALNSFNTRYPQHQTSLGKKPFTEKTPDSFCARSLLH